MPDYPVDSYEPIRMKMVDRFRRVIGDKAFAAEKRVDLGGFTGQNDGFTSMNILKPCDITHDMNKLPYPFKTNSAGVVIMTGTLEHLKDPKVVMQEIHRICKDGAHVFVSVPYYKFHTILYNSGHYHDFKVEWFNMGGFKMLDHWYLKGRARFWKKYHTYAVLKVEK
jgi:SAM-dependent methyltransferase